MQHGGNIGSSVGGGGEGMIQQAFGLEQGLRLAEGGVDEEQMACFLKFLGGFGHKTQDSLSPRNPAGKTLHAGRTVH